jgi:hypothetical protein
MTFKMNEVTEKFSQNFIPRPLAIVHRSGPKFTPLAGDKESSLKRIVREWFGWDDDLNGWLKN